MQQTTNYQLSQWAPEDRILRADFNTDNAKIDAAIHAARSLAEGAAQKAGAQLIRTVRVSSAASSVDLQLTDISWGDWNVIHFVITPSFSSGTVVSLYLNGSSSQSLGSMGDRPAHLILRPCFSGSLDVAGICYGDSAPFLFRKGVTFSRMTSILLSSNSAGQILSGTTIQIWGEK